MRPDGFNGISRENFPGLSEELESAFKVLNPVIIRLIQILQGKVSTDNLNDEKRIVEVLHNTPVKIRLQKCQNCQGALHLWNSIYDFCNVTCTILAQNEVEIKCFFTSAPIGKVKVRLWFVGESS